MGYAWKPFIRVKIDDKDITRFKRDVWKSMTKLKKMEDWPLTEQLGRDIVTKAKEYSPQEWMDRGKKATDPKPGGLKKGISWRSSFKGGMLNLNIYSSAKRGNIPYARIQEEGLDKLRKPASGPYMRFWGKDKPGLIKCNVAGIIYPTWYMERAIRDVLRENEQVILNSFDKWNKARLEIRGHQVSKQASLKPKRTKGPSDGEINKGKSKPKPTVKKKKDVKEEKERPKKKLSKGERMQRHMEERRKRLKKLTTRKNQEYGSLM